MREVDGGFSELEGFALSILCGDLSFYPLLIPQRFYPR